MGKPKPKPQTRPVPAYKPQGEHELFGQLVDSVRRARRIDHNSTADGKQHTYLFQVAAGFVSDVTHSPASQAALGSLAESACGAAILAALRADSETPYGEKARALLGALIDFRNSKELPHAPEASETLSDLKEAVSDREAEALGDAALDAPRILPLGRFDQPDGGAGADAEGSAEG
jgi:hypothetical protein